MSKSLLLVEDDESLRRGYSGTLRQHGWDVVEAADGEAALSLLRACSSHSAIILDLKLPDMNGFDLIDKALAQGLAIPPVFVVSAFVDDRAWRRFVELRLQGLLPKPLSSEYLATIIDAFSEGNETALVNLPSVLSGPLNLYSDALQLFFIDYENHRGYIYQRRNDSGAEGLRKFGASRAESLDDKTKRREGALKAHFAKCAQHTSGLETQEPLLVVARRWNSWYPSYFNVAGGAYAVLGAKSATGRSPGVLIDPGFRSVSVLKSLGVSVGNLNTCVVTHNHPDHVGGIFEYVASRHALGENSSVFCSSSTRGMLGTYRGNRLDVHELGRNNVDVIPPYDASGVRRRMVATPVPTCHHDAGDAEGTCGVLLASDIASSRDEFHSRSTTLVLGDTEYDPRRHSPNAAVFQKMREALERPDLKVAVFHIGCSQFKEGTGKHLYLPGLIAILKDLDHARRTQVDSDQPLLVLVSEWGLEHASAAQIRKALPDVAPELIDAFGPESLVRETIEMIEKSCSFDRIKLLPADVGLIVGMESGHVYIDGKYKTAPENVILDHNDDGLVYKALSPR